MNSKLICFTSACGGAGTSSAALCLGRILSRIEGYKVLYLSFDLISSKNIKEGRKCSRPLLYEAVMGDSGADLQFKALVSSDEYGLCYFDFADTLNPLHAAIDSICRILESLSEDYDYIIIDNPSNCSLGFAVYELCEYVVVVYGYRPYAKTSCDRLYEFLSEAVPSSELLRLEFSDDEESFIDGLPDIHGQFGAEVREFALGITGQKNLCS